MKWHDVLEDYPLEDRKLAMRSMVTGKREQQTAMGFVYDFGASFGGAHRLDTRPDDARRWISYRNICDDRIDGGYDTIDLSIRTSTNEDLLVPPAVGKAAMVAMTQREGAILKHSWSVKDQIQTAADHAALDAIDVNAGWPT